MSKSLSTPDGMGFASAALATSLTIPPILWKNPAAAIVFLVPAFIAVVIATFVPAYFVAKVGRQRQITSIFYFAGCALATGLFYGALWSLAASGQPLPFVSERLDFAAACVRYLPAFGIGALAGGVTYWLVAGRYSDRPIKR